MIYLFIYVRAGILPGEKYIYENDKISFWDFEGPVVSPGQFQETFQKEGDKEDKKKRKNIKSRDESQPHRWLKKKGQLRTARMGE